MAPDSKRNKKNRLLQFAEEGLLLSLTVLALVSVLAGCITPEDLGSEILPSETVSPEKPTFGATPTTYAASYGTEGYSPEAISTSGYIKRSFGYVPYSPAPEKRLTVMDTKEESDESGKLFISGRLKNEGTVSLGYVQVTFNLYDANGNLLGNAYASVEYLHPGKIWRFKTNSFDAKNYQFYEIAEILSL